MTEIKLRDYQREAIDAVFAAWGEGMRRPAIVLPTGAGKTVVFASLIKEWRYGAQYLPDRGSRVMVLAHRDELVDQAIAKIKAIAPDLKVGKVKAESDEITADVMVCSVQTLASARRRDRLRSAQHWPETGPVGLVITDECHHAAAASYKKIYAAFPDALQLGVTATMARGDGVGLGSTWEDVVYKRSILNLISKGHLVDVRTQRIDLKGLDLGAVKTSMKDWQAGDLGRALMESEADTVIARAYREHAGDRQGIVFTPTVETAHAASRELNRSGVTANMISGETPREARQRHFEDFRTGRVQVLVNCMVLTEGFDAPWAEVAVIARPTQSAPLYTQMVGRVLRPWPGKKEALVLDLVGASASKLRTLIDLEPGVVTAVLDGESLAEAEERETEERNQLPSRQLARAFKMETRDVDSFGGSDYAWNRTPAGVMFIGCGTVRVFLWATPKQSGLWDVCIAETGQPWKRTDYVGLDLGSAMAWGEAVAEDHQQFGVAKSAAWRRKRPSEAAKALACRLGIDVPEGMRAGELSTLMDARMGERIFDRFIGKG